MARRDGLLAALLGSGGAKSRFVVPQSLTASAVEADRDNTRNIMRLHQPWQTRLFGFYDKMGECWNPAQFLPRALSKAVLYPATGDPENPKRLTSGWAFEMVQQWQGLLEPYGRLRGLIGEGRLCQSVRPDAAEGTKPVWEFLSPTELQLVEDGDKISRLDGADRITYVNLSKRDDAGEPGVGEMRMWRFWRPHPKNSGMADSAFRGVLDLYEQLWWLTLSERADLRNRAVNQGIILVPEEIDFEPDDAEEEQAEGDDPELDPFEAQLHRMLDSALKDPGSASAASPGVVRGPAEFLKPDVFRHIRFHDPSSSLYVSDRERSLILRISIGLDMPVDEVMGIGALNHWNAWHLDNDRFAHIEPEGNALAKDLTEVVLRPIGRANNESDADEVFVAIDWAGLVSDPDRGKTAVILAEHGAIGYPALRKANDFDEKDAQTPEEHLEYLAIQLKDGSLVGGTAPSDGGGGATPVDQPAEPADPGAAPADEPAAASVMRERVIVAAAQEARFAVGRWVLSKRRSCPDCFDAIDTANPSHIVSGLGPSGIAAIEQNAAGLSARLRDRFYMTCEALGYTPLTEQAADVEIWFASTLWEQNPDMGALVVKLTGKDRDGR